MLNGRCVVKEIRRDIYLKRLIERKENGLIKVITGVRRSGKSYLLFKLYYDYLQSIGIDDEHIVRVQLDNDEFELQRDKKELYQYIKRHTEGNGTYYIFVDEIQFCDGFEGVLNGLLYRNNVDVYVTGSNSKSLSNDVLTEFRGRGDEVRVYPLTFSEFMQSYDGDKYSGWRDYYTFGGLPLVLSKTSFEAKSQYLTDLFKHIYLRDIIERNKIQNKEALETLVDIVASGIGSLTNPTKIANTFTSSGLKISSATIHSYLENLSNAFLISPVTRYNIKGRKYISATKKYYFIDTGLRNARLNFRQIEENHIMENVIFNELCVRGYNVDIGVIETETKDEQGKRKQKQLEIDFVCNLGSKKYYIQSALTLYGDEKEKQEKQSLIKIDDHFKKIIITNDNVLPYYNDDGILILNLFDFLLDYKSLDM